MARAKKAQLSSPVEEEPISPAKEPPKDESAGNVAALVVGGLLGAAWHLLG